MLECHDHGPIRELRLANPPVNALGLALVQRLDAELVAAAEHGVRALVLSGQPGMFSGGLDVREIMAATAESLLFLVETFFGLQARLARSPLPVIAAITGHCPAGGTVLALYCDHRVMARGAFRIGLNEVQMGLYPGPTIHRAFERLVGAAQAARLLPRGTMLDPEQALAAGLVDELAAPEQVVPQALQFAAQLLQLPPQAYARTRELVRADLRRLFDVPVEDLAAAFGSQWVGEEARARLAALLAR
ncbi:MAG: enoyl-CoA hydratase/isomerase family protein [Steroidobacteraceae bacterium]|nr:enoyl-CoA hydratase/isomerase family protein [Nevskiaceae bacterium]MCP5339683.1 enoyl-CoA hydratase/isomerase family protein [Nevskiaceae bacterium]